MFSLFKNQQNQKKNKQTKTKTEIKKKKKGKERKEKENENIWVQCVTIREQKYHIKSSQGRYFHFVISFLISFLIPCLP